MAGLRVFLSSTALDLEDHRRVADDTLLRLQQQSVAMERFGPLPGTPVEECERLAAECDLLVCIVAHRWGYEPEPGRGSITRREVEAARNAGRPVYAWIVDDAHPWPQPKEQDRLTRPDVLADAAHVRQVADAVRNLQEFKDWLRREVVTETFTTPDDLGRKIGIAVAQAAATAPGPEGRPARPELRIVHALQPAPHFRGREALVQMLSAWVDDTASPDRVHALVAAGGTGKTAVAEQVLSQLQRRWPTAGAGRVLVWSFYERPDADAFLRECAQLFLGEGEDAPAGGRLERLLRGLRDGRPHLVVLDGLERVQAEAAPGQVRGALEDHTLKLLLQAIAAGLGRSRALLTSRFPLPDLRDWRQRGMVETTMDDLSPQAARQVLRGWGVKGDDAQLDAVAEQVGRHALSVAVIGSYLSHFEAGRIEAAAGLQLDAAAGDDPKAAKLARVLALYAERLPADERELLSRLSVFPRGITLDVLRMLVDAGGAVAGALAEAPGRLQQLLQRLVDRGLAFRYFAKDGPLTWSAHPFVRERFAALLGCPHAAVFEAVAARLGSGLEHRPEHHPEEAALLDRYEQLIEATRLAGRPREAFDLYWFALGGYNHMAHKLGEYARVHRILCGFLPASGEPAGFADGLPLEIQSVGLNALALTARHLGRLHEARAFRHEDDLRKRRLDQPKRTSVGLRNAGVLAFDLGRLDEARAAMEEAVAQAQRARSVSERRSGLAYRARIRHRLGDVEGARADFAEATALEKRALLYSGRGMAHARHCLDLGDVEACRAICTAGLEITQRNGWNFELPGWHALFARMALAEGGDPRPHLAQMHAWTARGGEMEWIIEAHGLAARDALARGDLPGARAQAEDGLRQARLCGYRLLEIELLTALSAVHLAWPDAEQALAAARQALDLATAPGCGDAWGEADAAQAWGLALAALDQAGQAQRAFAQALAVRERIRHPGAQPTRARP